MSQKGQQFVVDDQFEDAADEGSFPLVAQVPPQRPLGVPSTESTTAVSKKDQNKATKRFLPRSENPTVRLWNNQNNKVRETEVAFVNNNSSLLAVKQAAQLVANQFRFGTWPELAPGVHLQTAVAVEQFASDVYAPYIQSQLILTQNYQPERIFISTLLALREVLAQNAENIFDLTTISDAANSNENTTNQQQDEVDSEVDCFTKMLLATSVVAAACEESGRDSDSLIKLIETSSPMPADRAHAAWIPMSPNQHNGNTLKREATLAWKVSYNLAHAQRKAAKQEVISLPNPTSCFSTVVENVPAMKKVDD